MTGTYNTGINHRKIIIPKETWPLTLPSIQEISVPGISSIEYPIGILDQDAIALENYSEIASNFNFINRIQILDDKIICEAYDTIPEYDIPLLIKRDMRGK